MDIYDEECHPGGGQKGNIPKDFLEHDAQLGGIQRENFRKAVKAGVKNVISAPTPASALTTEASKQFAFMVKYGMTPMQAIQAATHMPPIFWVIRTSLDPSNPANTPT